MPFTEEQQEAVRKLYADGLPGRGVKTEIMKNENRDAVASITTGFESWVNSLIASGRAQLDADDPILSAKISDDELTELLNCTLKVFRGEA